MDFMYHISLQQPHKNRGAAMLFEAGQAYVLSNTTALMKDASHHARVRIRVQHCDGMCFFLTEGRIAHELTMLIFHSAMQGSKRLICHVHAGR